MRSKAFVLHLRSGFTLVELMIVVTVIALVVALVIPNFLEARKVSDETAAISYLKSILTAQQLYRTRMGQYAESDERLVEAGLLSGHSIVDGENEISGYTFVVDGFGVLNWFAYAVPLEPGITGDRFFFVDATGVLRWSENGIPDKNSPPLDALSEPPPQS